nr:leucine zipper domain-containing protein [Neisseria dentiae]
MNIHKNTRLTPHNRQAIWRAYTQDKISVTSLAQQYRVSRVTIYRILKAARLQLLTPQKSTNNRFKQAKYGMKRLAKVEREIEEKLKKTGKALQPILSRRNGSFRYQTAAFATKPKSNRPSGLSVCCH